MGKEITRFHCVYWPAFLMAAGLAAAEERVWRMDGCCLKRARCRSRAGTLCGRRRFWKCWARMRCGIFCCGRLPFGQDGSFSFDALVQRYNSDLANGYGNLVSRALTMIGKYFDGVVPEAAGDAGEAADGAEIADAVAAVGQSFEALDFSGALERAVDYGCGRRWVFDGERAVEAGGGLTDEQQTALRATVLYTAAEAIRIITALVYPVLPEAAAKVWAQLGLGEIQKAGFEESGVGRVEAGHQAWRVGPVFPRAEKDAIDRMKEIEEKNAPAVARS